MGYRISIFMAGLWWLAFGAISLYNLKNYPGPPLPPGEHYLSKGWTGAWKTAGFVTTDLKSTAYFLLCWFIYSDGYALISNIGGLFANNEVDWGMIYLRVSIVCASLSSSQPHHSFYGNAFLYRLLQQGVRNHNSIPGDPPVCSWYVHFIYLRLRED